MASNPLIIGPFDIEAILKQYASDFRRNASAGTPQLLFHLMADGVFWSDEFPDRLPWELENVRRVVINHRTSLLTGEKGTYPEVWEVARRHFPRWIGFDTERSTPQPELARRIARLRRVYQRGIDRFFAEGGGFESLV